MPILSEPLIIVAILTIVFLVPGMMIRRAHGANGTGATETARD